MGRYDSLLETDQTPTPPSRAPSLPRPREEISSLPTITHTPGEEERANGPQLASPLSTKEQSMIASKQASYHASMIDTIRKTVRQVGKETAFVRLTPEEKQQLADIVYTYKRQGMKTSENEVCRIAINFLIEDYRAQGQGSILVRMIEAVYA